LACHSERSEESQQFEWQALPYKLRGSFASLRVCDFFGFLAIFEHLTHLLSMALFGNIQKNHGLSG
jgi:hypothetical protein